MVASRVESISAQGIHHDHQEIEILGKKRRPRLFQGPGKGPWLRIVVYCWILTKAD